MKPYSVTDLHHDLAQRLAPHSITIQSVVGTPDELTIEISIDLTSREIDSDRDEFTEVAEVA